MQTAKFSKNFWLTVLALFSIGLLIFVLVQEKIIVLPNGNQPPKDNLDSDKFAPATAILSPEDKSWHNSGFEVLINDSDEGLGLEDYVPGEKGCRYIIEDLGTGEVLKGFRKCDPVKIKIPVGKDKVCSSSFSKDSISQGKCKVSTMAIDKSGNSSGWKSKVFNIDIVDPQIGEIVSESVLELNKKYSFSVTVSDNSKISGCWFYLDGRISEEQVKINSVPCEKENQCVISAEFTFDTEAEHFIVAGCSDVAGNLGFSKKKTIKVSTNHAPEISFCKSLYSQGTIGTEFPFEVSASDKEGDRVSYLWDFGDGKTSTDQNPVHSYNKAGLYKPKIEVSDDKGLKSECFTPWITVTNQ